MKLKKCGHFLAMNIEYPINVVFVNAWNKIFYNFKIDRAQDKTWYSFISRVKESNF